MGASFYEDYEDNDFLNQFSLIPFAPLTSHNLGNLRITHPRMQPGIIPIYKVRNCQPAKRN